MISKETYKKLWEVNPQGNKEDIRYAIDWYVKSGGDPDFLYDKYSRYVMWWKAKFGERELKYIGKNDELMNLNVFISQGEYNKDYVLSNQSGEHYLGFDIINTSILEKSYTEFSKQFIKNTTPGN